MSKVFKARHTAAIEGDFVVFLIGMRINRLWRFWEWWPVFMAMPGMLRELYEHPELGFLGTEYFLSFSNRAPMLVQYWRSFEHLEAYARAQDQAHLPAWRNFNRTVRPSGTDTVSSSSSASRLPSRARNSCTRRVVRSSAAGSRRAPRV